MKCRIVAIDDFNKDAKRLGKKYVSLKGELKELETQLLLLVLQFIEDE